MNELYFEGYGYFRTETDKYDKAMDEFLEAAEKAGIEIIIEKAELRNEDGEVIDE